jgi:hypothetical protein
VLDNPWFEKAVAEMSRSSEALLLKAQRNVKGSG